MARGSGVAKPILADRLGIRTWPALVFWLLVYPVTITLVILSGQGALVVRYLDTIVVGGLILGVALLINQWYFERLERIVVEPDTTVTDLSGTPVGSVSWLWAGSSGRPPRGLEGEDRSLADVFAVGAWGLLWGVNMWVSLPREFSTFGPELAPIALPWGPAVTTIVYIGWGYFLLAGFSLLFHYARRWRLLRQWVETSSPPRMPEGDNHEEWTTWEGRWRVYSEGLKSVSVVHFKGFATILIVLAVATWAWVVAFQEGAGFHPVFLGLLATNVAVVIIYLLGPSWVAWRRVQEVQGNLSRAATGIMQSAEVENPEGADQFPIVVSWILGWSSESHFNLRHGNPEAAVLGIGSYVFQNILATVSAVTGFAF